MSEVTAISSSPPLSPQWGEATDLAANRLRTQKLRQWTREEYMKMAELGVLAPGERVELIEGEIIQMSPQNSPHATAVILGRCVTYSLWSGLRHSNASADCFE